MRDMKNKKVEFQDWGLIDYEEAWDRQEALIGQTVDLKTRIRNKKMATEGDEYEEGIPSPNYLVFCEHPHVYTLVKSGKTEHLLLEEQGLKDKKASYYSIYRGGDITYHGPGQIVG